MAKTPNPPSPDDGQQLQLSWEAPAAESKPQENAPPATAVQTPRREDLPPAAGGLPADGVPDPSKTTSTSRVAKHRRDCAGAGFKRVELMLMSETLDMLTSLAKEAGMSRARFCVFVLGRVRLRKLADGLVRAARQERKQVSGNTLGRASK
jgi:hypothetical protein